MSIGSRYRIVLIEHADQVSGEREHLLGTYDTREAAEAAARGFNQRSRREFRGRRDAGETWSLFGDGAIVESLDQPRVA